MIKRNRVDTVFRLLEENGTLSVTEIARTLDVSEATARRDLKVLQLQEKIARSYGVAGPVQLPGGYRHGADAPTAEERAIAKGVLSLIQGGHVLILPGGRISRDGTRWISARPAFLLPVRVLGALFRRLFLTRLRALHDAGKLAFFGSLTHLAERRAFLRHLSPVRKKRWVVYAKPPFAGPEAVLAYLARYTHRVAISNSRLLRFDEEGVTFRYKDYRKAGAGRQQVMTLAVDEFIRRFLLHALPRGFHRIRHYGLLASARRKDHLERARRLLDVAPPPSEEPTDDAEPRPTCPCCGGTMIIIEVFERRYQPRAPPQLAVSSGTPAP